VPNAPGCSLRLEIATAGSKSVGKANQGSRGSSGRGCESVDMRPGCMTSVATAVDQGNCILRSQLWGNTALAGTSNYLKRTGMTGARDAEESAQIGWKWRGRVGVGSVWEGELGEHCSKCRGMEPLRCFRIAGEGKGRWKDKGNSHSWIRLETVFESRRSELLRCRDDALKSQSSWRHYERENRGCISLASPQSNTPPVLSLVVPP